MTIFKRFVGIDRQEAAFWFVLVFTFIANGITLKDGHNWGDDFAQYILSAFNLIDGRPFQVSAVYGVDVSLPPFYSILILPWLKFFGLNFVLLKSLNILFWILEVWGVYCLVRSRFDRDLARAAAVLTAMSSYFFVFKQNLLTDIPFAVELLWAVVFFERYLKDGNARFFYLFLIISSAGLLTRSAALVLFVAAGLFLFYSKKKDPHWKRDIVFSFLACLLTLGLQKFFFGMGKGFFDQIFSDPWSYVQHCLHNANQAWAGLLYTIVPGQTDFSGLLFMLIAHVPYYGAAFFVMLFISTIYFASKGRLDFVGCVFVIYMFMMLGWSWVPHSAYHFARFLLPVYGILLYLCVKIYVSPSLPGMKMRKAVLRGLCSLVVLFNAGNILYNWNFNDDEILCPSAKEMCRWVVSHVQHEDEVIFIRPKALHLMTGVSAVWVRDWRVLDAHKKYIILFNKKQDPLWDVIRKVPADEILKVWANDDFSIYRLTKFPPTLSMTLR